MSELPLRDVNIVPECGRMKGSSIDESYTKPDVETMDENAEEGRKKKMTSQVGIPIMTDGTENSGAILANSEVEYIDSKDLKDVEDVENCLKTLLSDLGSKDWVPVCDALNNLRRLTVFHKETVVNMLNDVIYLVVKSMKNPRSAVCKTAIMTSADIFKAYNDYIIDSLDPLLVQLLLKSSQDKRFVCEAAESALIALTSSVSPLLLLPKLQPYIKSRNPRIRAKASMCISRSVPQLGVDEMRAFGTDTLVQIGASQLSDQLPESRDAARALLLELRSLYEKSISVSEGPATASWERFCLSKLSPLSAQAVLRVTTISCEALLLGS